MATDPNQVPQDNGVEVATGASKKKMIIFLLLALLLIGLAGGGTTYFLLMDDSETSPVEQESAEPTKKGAEYLALGDPFIVDFNVGGKQRFLQIYITVMARDKAPLSALETHMPLIRNNLNLVIGQQDFAALATAEGKQALKDQVLVAIQTVLKAETGDEGIESVLFTNFVVQ